MAMNKNAIYLRFIDSHNEVTAYINENFKIGENYDVVIQMAGGTTLHTHWQVMSLRSDHPNFLNDEKADVIGIMGATKVIMEPVTKLMYTGEVVISEEDLPGVASVLSELRIGGVVAQKFRGTLNPNNVLSLNNKKEKYLCGTCKIESVEEKDPKKRRKKVLAAAVVNTGKYNLARHITRQHFREVMDKQQKKTIAQVLEIRSRLKYENIVWTINSFAKELQTIQPPEYALKPIELEFAKAGSKLSTLQHQPQPNESINSPSTSGLITTTNRSVLPIHHQLQSNESLNGTGSSNQNNDDDIIILSEDDDDESSDLLDKKPVHCIKQDIKKEPVDENNNELVKINISVQIEASKQAAPGIMKSVSEFLTTIQKRKSPPAQEYGSNKIKRFQF